MTFRDTIKLAWAQFSLKQKLTILLLSLVLMISILAGGINSFTAWREDRQAAAEAAKAKKDADDAMKKAAQVAAQILEREAELQKQEEKRDEKQTEVDEAKTETRDALNDVNRARVQPRADKPSASKLCAELAELGYPCR